ncbi:bifunctional transcriptional activator/DNA repair enzyme AdaA [Paenibacillus tarimensis]
MDIISGNILTDDKWQAIINNDAAYDGYFIYAVLTTGIFCRPSCKSKSPNKENVRIFLNTDQALSANFRPCKRCKPASLLPPGSEWVNQIANYIEANYSESLSLEKLAQTFHGSPYHLHRTFKRIKGQTPVEYIRQTRINAAKKQLVQSDKTISDIGTIVGIPNAPYFTTLFKKITGQTPASYRKSAGMALDAGGIKWNHQQP